MKGLVTGLELPDKTGRGRPLTYVSPKARRLHARWRELQGLIMEVAQEHGFTPEAEKRWRGEFFRLGNLLNYNRLKHRKKNPPRRVHAQLAFGMPRAVCGYVVTSVGSDALVADPAVVTCSRCRAANFGDEKTPDTYGRV